MLELKYEIIGDKNFLRNIEYTAYISELLKDFETNFLLAEHVEIQFLEEIIIDPNKFINHTQDVSDDGLIIKLQYKISRRPNNGKMSNPPSPAEFFKGLKFFLENTVVKEDNERFKKLNTN